MRMRSKLLSGAALAAILGIGGYALAQTVLPTVTTLNATDYMQVRQVTGPGFQWVTLTTLANFIRTTGSTIATVALGGTGRATLTAHSPLIGNGTTAVSMPTAGATGQVLMGVTGGDPVFTSGYLSTAATQSATTGLTLTPLSMTAMRTAAGLMMTASASSTNFGLTYTPGTTGVLIGTATSSSTTGNTAAMDVVLPPWYVAGTDITLKVGCYYTESSGSTTTHTMAAAAYLNTVAGLQGSTLIATTAQTCPITTSALQTFTITGTTLLPGSHLTLTFTAAVANSTGASTEWLTSASIN